MRARLPARRGRRYDTLRPSQVLLRGGAATLALAALLFLATQAINGVPGRDYRTVYVSAPQVGNLIAHDQVRVAGVRVGQVLERTVTPDGRPRIELQIEPGVRLPRDTDVAIRALGLLGSRYVELIPGTADAELRDGATLRADATAYTSGLPEALEVLDGPTLDGLGTSIDETALGMLGNGAPVNEALRLAGGATRNWLELADTVLERDGALERLAPALRAAATPLDENREGLAHLTRVTSDALAPLVTERVAVRETLDRAPGAFASVAAGLGEGRRLLASLDALTSSANRTLTSAPDGLAATARMLSRAPGPIARAQPLIEAADGAVPRVLRLTSAATPLLAPVRHLVDTVRPVLAQVIPKGCDLKNFGAAFRSMTGFSQPGADGDSGPPEGFRAVVIPTLTAADAGIEDTTGLFMRDHYSPPCRWRSRPYVTGALERGGR